MHGDGIRFFRGVGPNIVDRYFDLAWVWQWDPRRALSLGFDELQLYETQTLRILDEVRRR
jgi:hypothetical protein